MKTRGIVLRCFFGLSVTFLLFINSCEKDFCAECTWDDYNCADYPHLTSHKSFCAPSYAECEDQINEFLNSRWYPECWDCTIPRQ